MPLNRNKLYTILTIALVAGYIWIFFNFTNTVNTSNNKAGICIVKHVTNIPCPSCGATRSVLSILKGDFLDSLYWNPIGLIILIIMIIAPLWIGYDYFFKKDTLFIFYKKKEEVLKQKKVAIPAISLILINWIWNIYKDL